MFSTITPRLFAIGKALLGETTTGYSIGIKEQHVILSGATLAELVAAKAIIERYHSMDTFALLMVDCYLSAKSRSTVYAVAS